MQKQRSFQLPRVSLDSPRHRLSQCLNEQAAEDTLFEISKDDEPRTDSFWKEFSKLSLAKKRHEKSAASAPKRKQLELLPTVDLASFRHPVHDAHLILNTTSYMVIDDRKANRPREPNPLQEHANRKAKYLFRSRNRGKAVGVPQNQPFLASFYCHKLAPENT